MSVIVLVSDYSPSNRGFAAAVADKLSYRFVEPEVVIERAAARGFAHQELREALEKPPGVLRRFLHTPRIHLTMLRAALIEEVRQGNVVCYGNLGLLLPRFEGVFWIRVDQSQEMRCANVRERLRLSSAEATAWVQERDRDAHLWRRWVFKPEHDGGIRGSFSVDLETVGVDQACDAIALIVRTRVDDVGVPRQLAVLEDLALSCRVEAALALDPATAHLELEVQADRGSVHVQGRLRNVDQLDDVRRVIEDVEGVTDVSPAEVCLPNDELVASSALKPWTRAGNANKPNGMNPRFIWATMAAVMVLVIFYSVAVSKVGSTLSNALGRPAAGGIRAFTGIITDTKCAGNHAAVSDTASTECVRRCVRTGPGIKLALQDHNAQYVLADQEGGDKFAGRRAAVVGYSWVH